MKKLILTLIFGCMAVAGLSAQNWQTDFPLAKKLAAEENKVIVLVFQGSDWCAPCIKLDREVWNTATFKEYAKNHFVMVQADFPRKKKNGLSEDQQAANKNLAKQYNKRGIFPFVVVLDQEGNVLGETGYQKVTPEEYIKILTSFSG